ncbi:MAG TPA: permease [Gemmataceae bacterium]|nr:permease [Gemmataceae bacterium]
MFDDPNKLIQTLTKDFTSILYEALPFIVLGVLLAGLLEEFVPQQFIARIVPRRRWLHIGAIALGGLLGLIFPMCECGIIPVMRRLLRKGVPLSVCVCYVLAGPIINVVVITSTWVAFKSPDNSIYGNPWIAVGLRVGLGFLVAFVTSLIVDWQHRKHGNAALLSPLVMKDTARSADLDEAGKPRRSAMRSIGNITETALNDFVDIMAFLVLGALIASFARLAVPSLGLEGVLKEAPVLAIPIMMFFAFVFCLCSEADAFVGANFQPISLWPDASIMSFLVLGPMLDIKLVMMYTRVFRRRLILTIFGAVVVQVLLYTLFLYVFGNDIFGPSRRGVTTQAVGTQR